MAPEQSFDFSTDLPPILAFNARRSKDAETRLHTEIEPAIYEGRIGAPLTWLLANPSFDTTPGYAFNQPPKPVPGWAMQSLAPEHRAGYGKWAWDRTRELREALGDQHVSNNVIAIQMCPWASQKFDAKLRLPSRIIARELVLHQLKAGSHFVLVRSRKEWLELVPELATAALSLTGHTLTPHLTKGNLGNHWEAVHRATAGGVLSP